MADSPAVGDILEREFSSDSVAFSIKEEPIYFSGKSEPVAISATIPDQTDVIVSDLKVSLSEMTKSLSVDAQAKLAQYTKIEYGRTQIQSLSYEKICSDYLGRLRAFYPDRDYSGYFVITDVLKTDKVVYDFKALVGSGVDVNVVLNTVSAKIKGSVINYESKQVSTTHPVVLKFKARKITQYKSIPIKFNWNITQGSEEYVLGMLGNSHYGSAGFVNWNRAECSVEIEHDGISSTVYLVGSANMFEGNKEHVEKWGGNVYIRNFNKPARVKLTQIPAGLKVFKDAQAPAEYEAKIDIKANVDDNPKGYWFDVSGENLQYTSGNLAKAWYFNRWNGNVSVKVNRIRLIVEKNE